MALRDGGRGRVGKSKRKVELGGGGGEEGGGGEGGGEGGGGGKCQDSNDVSCPRLMTFQ